MTGDPDGVEAAAGLSREAQHRRLQVGHEAAAAYTQLAAGAIEGRAVVVPNERYQS
jgi:hypothetical protein